MVPTALLSLTLLPPEPGVTCTQTVPEEPADLLDKARPIDCPLAGFEAGVT